MQVVKIDAQLREPGRKKAVNKLRKQKLVPAVIYGGEKASHLIIDPATVRSLVYTPEFKVVELNIEGDVQKCILKAIQFHPVTDEIVHMDFLRIIEGVPIKVNIPLHFEGTSKGVSNGGRLVKELRRIEVKVLPSNLVDHLVIDITSMKMGDSLRVRDIQVEEGIEMLIDGSIPVAIVQVPRALLKAGAIDEDGEDEEGVEAVEETTEG